MNSKVKIDIALLLLFFVVAIVIVYGAYSFGLTKGENASLIDEAERIINELPTAKE